jgi:hypothetical protein
MNEKDLDIATFKIIYSKYKKQILYWLVILSCIIMFFIYTLPGVLNIPRLSEERKFEEEKLKIINNNLALLKNSDESALDEQIGVSTSALPLSKDYVGILNAISIASIKSGAGVKDYSLSVGEITEKGSAEEGYPSLDIGLSLQGSQEQIVAFISNIYQTVPLSEVLGVNLSKDSATLNLKFYYKAQPPSNFSEDSPLNPISAESLGTIRTISEWETLPDFSEVSETVPEESEVTGETQSSEVTPTPSL